MTTTPLTASRIRARVLLLDPDDRVLLIHARDPDDPDHHWWETPGGGLEPGETDQDAAIREVAEETGLVLDHLGPCLWTRETRFHYRGREHSRVEHVYLGRTDTSVPTTALKPSDNEKLGLIERRWWTGNELAQCTDELLPPALPELLAAVLAGQIGMEPLQLPD
jgi:8-oxo-dGTP pyrophosphatase MutT (NUDIX family)